MRELSEVAKFNEQNTVQNYLKSKSFLNWETGFYQYANRVAHLYFLRCICNLKAYLIFLYFLNDYTHIPTTQKEWDGAIKLQKRLLSLKRHRLQRYMTDIFIDVNTI